MRHSLEGIRRHVTKVLQPLWQGHKQVSRQYALAISGGVDSMALATICLPLSMPRPIAFIVDHGVRSDSATEAGLVSGELSRVGIESRILKLDWSGYGNTHSPTNFEAVARKLRYQALGKACQAEGIENLILAHHADDQSETVLMRMLKGYTGVGLKATAPVANIPECRGMYGVDGSGRPKMPPDTAMAIESGGIRIHRPLLPFTKDDLIRVCEESGTKWFEDPTNADQRYTLRNAVRYLQKADVLPMALRRERLCALAQAMRIQVTTTEERARQLLQQQLSVSLDTRLGTASVTVPKNFTTAASTREEDHRIKATLIRDLVSLVAPVSAISLQDLDLPVDFMFSEMPHTHSQVNIASAQINHRPSSSPQTFLLHRSPPPANSARSTPLKIPQIFEQQTNAVWSEWVLWDGRYWIGVGKTPTQTPRDDQLFSLTIEFLTKDLLGKLRKTLTTDQRRHLNTTLKAASANIKWTIPVLVAATGQPKEVVVFGLPTLGWNNPQFGSAVRGGIEYGWEVRYKSVRSVLEAGMTIKLS